MKSTGALENVKSFMLASVSLPINGGEEKMLASYMVIRHCPQPAFVSAIQTVKHGSLVCSILLFLLMPPNTINIFKSLQVIRQHKEKPNNIKLCKIQTHAETA